MKLSTNKRPYNTIGEVHHVLMDKQEFEYLRLSIKNTTALRNLVTDTDKFKHDAFIDEKFLVVITPDDCPKPDHKMSFFFFGKINPKYIVEYNKYLDKHNFHIDELPKNPMLCIYKGNTDRFRKFECSCTVSESDLDKLLVEGPAFIEQNGFRGILQSNLHNYGSYSDHILLEILKKEKGK